MIYIPNPKALVYGELNFISTAVPLPQAKISVDQIFDEVSAEILALYVGEEEVVSPVMQFSVEVVEITN